MKHRRLIFLLWLAMSSCGLVAPAEGAIADRFDFPLHQYPLDDGCLEWGMLNPDYKECGKAGQHLADDACAPAGTHVYAAANGVVKYAHHYKVCPNWEWLVIVEHELRSGERVCLLYGHVQPHPSTVPGKEVSIGEYLGDIVEISCWPNHVHFGIYYGPYNDISCDSNEGWCNAAGYMCQDLFPGNYTDPVQFVLDHSATGCEEIFDSPGQSFKVTDSAGENLMVVFPGGHIGLRGRLYTNSSTAPSGFVIDGGGAWVTRSGDLHLQGNYYCRQAGLLPTDAKEFCVEGNGIRVITESGV